LTCSIYLDGSLNQTNNSVQNGTLTSFLINGISYGSHSWYINCTDGELSNVSEIRYFTINDTISPQIQFVAPTTQTGNYSQNYIEANVTAFDDNLDTITIYLYNSTGLVNSTSGSSSPLFINFTDLQDDTYYLNATANDTFGNSNRTETMTIVLDTIAPLIYYNPNTDENGTYNKNWIFINVTCFDLHKEAVILNWNGTNESFDNQAGDIYWENKTALVDGTYTFYAWCNDTAGNSNQTEIRQITLDTTAPNVTLNSPNNGLVTGNSTIVFNCSADDMTNLANITLWLNLSGWHANETQEVSGASNLTVFIKTFDVGTYEWSCSACDFLGNCNNSAENRTFVIDLNAPSISYVSPTDPNNAYVSRLWTYINITVSDPNNVSACWLEWNGINESMAMVGFGENVYCYINKSDNEGIYVYNVYANDTSGNIGSRGVRTITFDITSPSIENLTITNITTNSAIISWQTNEYANSTINYGIDLNLSYNKSDSNFVVNHSIMLTGLNSKTKYYFNIISCDLAGNCNVSGPYNFTTLSTGEGEGEKEEKEEGGEKGAEEEEEREGKVIEITKESKRGVFEGSFGEKDKLLFTFKYTTHSLTIENIKENYVDIIIRSDPIYDRIYLGEAKSYDLDKDGRADIFIEILGIKKENNNSSLADIRIYLLECICPKPSEFSGCVNGKQTRVVYECSEKTNYTCIAKVEERECEEMKKERKESRKGINIYLLIPIFVILFILVFLILLKITKKQEKKLEKIKFFFE